MASVEVALTAGRAYEAGISVVPVKEDGSKAPAVPRWKQYQTTRPTEAETEAWFAQDRYGLGFLTGEASGNLEMFELEGRAVERGILEEFVNRCEAAGVGDAFRRVTQGYWEKTPGGGHHWLYRCSEIAGNEKLARLPAEVDPVTGEKTVPVLIETRGRGGFTVAAPSNGPCHENGGAWTLTSGGVESIATITPAERAAIWDVARSFDEYEASRPKSKPKQPKLGDTGDGPGVADDYDRRHTWTELLEAEGWTKLYTAFDGNERWRAPGERIGHQATVGDNGDGPFYNFDTGLAIEEDTAYSKFQFYAGMHHDGDLSAAAKELFRQGYGDHGRAKSTKEEEAPEPPPDYGDDEEPQAAQAKAQGDEGWEEPTPLGHAGKLPAFPVEVFPNWIADLVRAVSRATQTPPDLAGLLVMSGLSVIMIGNVEIIVADGWIEEPSFYTTSALPSGELKTPVFKAVQKPIEAFDAEVVLDTLRERDEAVALRDIADQRVADLKRQAARAKDSTERLKLRHEVYAALEEAAKIEIPSDPGLLVEDVTPEKLKGMMAEHGERIAIFGDEAGPFAGMAGRYESNQSGAPTASFDIYLKAHDGSPDRTHRVSRAANVLRRPTWPSV